jgi:DNA-binding response OmpR family regulator
VILSDGSRQRILVVDNLNDAADSMALWLTMWGYDAQASYGGAAALVDAHAHRPNVVLLDIGMPEMDGFQFALRLRAEPAFAETVVIGITGWSTKSCRIRAREFGFDHYLLKPVELDELKELLVCAASGREEFVKTISSRPAPAIWSR